MPYLNEKQKLDAYTFWLSQRGVRYPVINSGAQRASIRPQYNKIFFVSQSLSDVEAWQDLYLKIAAAVVREQARAQLLSVESLINLHNDIANTWIVFFDEISSQNIRDWLDQRSLSWIVIPHPRDMLKNPTLKFPAWEQLKKVKDSIDPVLNQ